MAPPQSSLIPSGRGTLVSPPPVENARFSSTQGERSMDQRNLAALQAGSSAIIEAIHLGHAEAESLRRVGIREGSRVLVISQNQPMLLQVENTRLAISHRLAAQIQICA